MAELSRQELENLYVLKMALAERRADDPLFKWNALPRQKPFIKSVLHDEKDENWFIAANRSGKSAAGAYIGSCLARFGNDPKWNYSGSVPIADRATSGWVVSLDFPASRDIIQPKYFDNGFVAGGDSPFIPPREIHEWRVSDQILKLKNGSLIGFKSADSGRLKFQGADKDWVHFDEEPPESIYEETVIRIGAGRKLRVFGTCTLLPPEGMAGGVTWMFSKMIQPFQNGKKPTLGIFGSSIYDNIHLAKTEIARLEAIYPLGSTQRRIRLDGEYLPGLAGARAYPNFDRRLHVRECPPIYQRRPLCWLWDFNVEPQVSIVGQKDGDLFRVYRTLWLDEGNIPEMCQMFVDYMPNHYGEIWIYGDSTGKNRHPQTGISCYTTIMNSMRTYGAPIRLKLPDSNPFVPDRINAVQRALKDENGEVHVEIDNTEDANEELIADLEQVLRDNKGGIKKTNDRKDSYYRRTHTSDAFGYWINYDAPVRIGRQQDRKVINLHAPGYAWNKAAS